MAGTLSVQKIQGLASSATPTTVEVSSGHVLQAPGHVIQVVSSTLTSAVTGTGTSIVDTGLTATITPTSASNKVYVNGYITLGTQTFFTYCWLVRGSTQIFKGDAASSRPVVTIAGPQYAGGHEIYGFEPTPFQYLDSPSTTSATTYKIQIRQYGSQAWYVNRTHQDRDNADYEPRGTSVITLMEIAA
tara:strand:+ start:462 stop:1025 length:564 start_codon:yes stop_codon:yes gene_type:complete